MLLSSEMCRRSGELPDGLLVPCLTLVLQEQCHEEHHRKYMFILYIITRHQEMFSPGGYLQFTLASFWLIAIHELNGAYLVSVHKHRFHRRDAKDAEKFFNENNQTL